MMNRLALLVFLLLSGAGLQAQYAPQAGLAGSTAVSATGGQVQSWATGCVVKRGYLNIANPALGRASAGDSSLAVGPADEFTVSLGDSGVAVLTFAHPIFDGQGPDFAVFENGFRNDTDSTQAFLELAFVEVSSDGFNYFRFPSASLTQTITQIGNGDYLVASNLDNLAGKYVAMYGTPFDLAELRGTEGLDVNNVTHVRIVDVVGAISGNGISYDHSGRMINDPYPTPFPTCGFDLDAVGVLNEMYESVKQLPGGLQISVYPVPADDQVFVSVSGAKSQELHAVLTSLTGNCLGQYQLAQSHNAIPLSGIPSGMYFLTISDANGNQWTEKVIRR